MFIIAVERFSVNKKHAGMRISPEFYKAGAVILNNHTVFLFAALYDISYLP